METDNFQTQTPQKIIRSQLMQQYQQNFLQNSIIQNDSQKPITTIISPSPTASMYKQFCTTPHSLRKSTSSSNQLNLFPILNTPPNRKNKNDKVPKVINPFEQYLADRLHLPLICSPSLFQRPATPQLCSTQFEWTIDEVSSLGPANVEPHETQFHDSLDPDIEAKAQAAISSYFKENVIVPSPSECQLKYNEKAKLINESYIKEIKRVRDGTTQTILTLPPILPIELELALKPYMKYNVDQQQSPSIPFDLQNNKLRMDYEARDASLRRKLFDIPNNYLNQNDDTIDNGNDEFIDYDCEAFSPPPKTPEMEVTKSNFRISDNISINKNSFGSLSPISKISNTSTSIKQNFKKLKSKCSDKSFNNIIKSNVTISIKLNRSLPNQSLYRSTPDLSSKLLNLTETNKISTPNLKLKKKKLSKNNHIIDNSFNNKISNLMVTSNIKKSISDNNLSESFNDIADIDVDDDDYEMHISNYSNKSLDNSLLNEKTPKSKRRNANRKNLSHSFSIYSDDDENNKQIIKLHSTSENNNKENLITTLVVANNNLLRMDSGFNEIDNINDEFNIKNSNKIIMNNNYDDISIKCCSSTPSKKGKNF